MTRKSLALVTADPSRSALSARIPEGCAGYRSGQRNAWLPGNAKFKARILRRL
jgi:hypothetical protein